MKRLRLDEVDGESPRQVSGEEETKGGSFGVGTALIAVKGESEQGKKKNLVELGGMAGDAVAEVHSPRKGCGYAEGIIGESSEEAADATHGNADAERDGEEVSGAGVNALHAFGNFDGDPAAEKSTNDCLAARKEEVSPSYLREGNLFKKAEKARAEKSSDGCGSDDEPAMIVGEKIAATVPRPSIDGIAYCVGEGLEDGVETGVRSEGHVRPIVCRVEDGLATLSTSSSRKSPFQADEAT